ncbi:MAG TPA: YezD family protein [Methylococcaceae bacterium]|nr:YezD family protein [Methylococcaceae bacterium]
MTTSTARQLRDTVDADEPVLEAARQLLAALKGIRYGAVEITIHDGRVVQIERREKQRLDLPTAAL